MRYEKCRCVQNFIIDALRILCALPSEILVTIALVAVLINQMSYCMTRALRDNLERCFKNLRRGRSDYGSLI